MIGFTVQLPTIMEEAQWGTSKNTADVRWPWNGRLNLGIASGVEWSHAISFIYIYIYDLMIFVWYIYMVFQCISMYFNPIGWFESIMNWAYRMSQIDVQNKGGINVVRDSYLSCKADLTIWNSMDGSMGISGSIWMEVFSLVPYFSGHIFWGYSLKFGPYNRPYIW